MGVDGRTRRLTRTCVSFTCGTIFWIRIRLFSAVSRISSAGKSRSRVCGTSDITYDTVEGVFEVWTDGHDLVNEVLDADDEVAPELLLDQVVGGDWRPLAVELDKSPLVD